MQSAFGEQARDYGIATEAVQAEIVHAWNEWKSHESAWFIVPNGELLIRA